MSRKIESTQSAIAAARLKRSGKWEVSPPDGLAVLAVVRSGTIVAAAASAGRPDIRASHHHDRLEPSDDRAAGGLDIMTHRAQRPTDKFIELGLHLQHIG